VRLRVTLAVVVSAVAALACAAPKPRPPSAPSASSPAVAPVFGISTVPRLVPAPGPKDYLDALDEVRSAGAHASFESASWSDLATPAGLNKLVNALGSAQQHFDVVLLTLKVIDTTNRTTPADLAGLAFDAPEVQRRFHALVDTLKPSLGAGLRYLSIGNEVDVYLAAHPATFDAYARFYADAVAYVHATLPGVRVGVTGTFEGARGGFAAKLAQLNQSSDVEVLTYYPLGARFVPRSPSTAKPDIAQMLQIAAGRPLVLQEVGYPSAARLSSSEGAQAEFATQVMAAWHAAGDRIPLLNWFALGDLTTDVCDTFTSYYQLPGDPNFSGYLCSLGLRRADGVPKYSWQSFVDAAARRS
jgi:hypothetical protein